MISLYEGPAVAIAQSVAALQARAYAPTGMRAWSSQEIASLLSNPCARLFTSHVGAAQNGHLNGFLFATVVAGEAEILSLAVDPSYLRRRIASRLVEELVDDCQRRLTEDIILEVAENNHPALSLYTAFAFERVGSRPDYYALNGRGIDAYILKKHISPNRNPLGVE